jgi:arginine utilization protein RocB
VHNDWEHVGARVVSLAERLVACPSIVDTPGEGELSRLLLDYLRRECDGLNHVSLRAVTVDKQPACDAILAVYEPPVRTSRTLVLLGHFDTVGIEPYGSLDSSAFSSAELKNAYADHADSEVRGCAQSPDWAFGRGWHDMKGGVAAITEVFLREARLRELPCNLVLGLAPDEESASRGIRALIPALNDLRRDHGWEVAYIVNADYTAPLHPGDEKRYFYSGTVGKMLLGVSVFGKNTHVGETFHGVNASALGGFLASQLEHDRKLLAGIGGEWLPPPTVLHIADRRERYDVMTMECAELYVNVFHLGGNPKREWRRLIDEVRRLTKLWDRQQRLRYNRFVARADVRLPRYEQTPEVIGFSELVRRVTEVAGAGTVAACRNSNRHADERNRALAVIRNLHAQLPPGRPLVIVSLLPPFYPAQLNSADKPDTAKLIELARENGLTHRRVYPYIADLSYFAFAPEATEGWEANAPLWFDQTELQALQAAATPVCNLGPWGAGAHSETERVYLPYLRDTLPRLLSEALNRLAR